MPDGQPTGDGRHALRGGVAITDAQGSTAYVCNRADGANGADGQSFDGMFTSPNGKFSSAVGDTGITLAGPFSSLKLDPSGTIDVIADTKLSMLAGGSASLNAGASLSLTASGNALLQAAGRSASKAPPSPRTDSRRAGFVSM